jgi:2-polyprenyl-6-methoxyphenol hydroxylase-like FAD-dependent oxidoreductase
MEPITIIGGGIGGLTLGMALKQNGVDYEIYERADEYRPLGAGIILRSNAMQIYERLGIDERIREMGADIEGDLTYSGVGTVLSDNNFRDQIEPTYGQVDAGIHRAKLQNMLLDHNDAGAIHTGKECEGVVNEDDSVRVRFADGTEIETEIVVGADGAHSTVREELFPDISVRYTNQVGHRGIPDIDVSHGNRLTQAWGKGISVGIVPLAEQEAYWFAVLNAEPGQEYDHRRVKELLQEKVRDMPDPFPNLIANTNPEDLISHDYLDLPPLDTWSKGRVTLMGDAAHSMTPFIGQGGCQAIEDAYVLGQVLHDHDSPQQAFEEYEDLRIEKANEILEASLDIGENATLESYPRRKIRNLLFKFYISRRVMPEQNELIAELNY